MKRLVRFYFVAIFLLAFSLSALGQDAKKIERELVGHIKNIEKWSVYTNKSGEDLTVNLGSENKTFQEKLLKYTKQASTLRYKFGELSKHLSIATSEDGKFRIYSWDTQSGGTMHFHKNVLQYQGEGGKVFSEGDKSEEGDPGGFYSEILELETVGGKIYLGRFHAILSNSLAYQSINFYEIKNDTLNGEVNLIETEAGMEDRVSVEYDFFSVVDRKERPIKVIFYDKAVQSIKVPVIAEDEEYTNGKVTDKFTVYKFNGKHFVKTD